MKHFCEQIIEFHENKRISTKPNKEKKSVILVEKGVKEKKDEKVPQKKRGASPNLKETSDWIQSEKKEVRPLPGIMGIKVKYQIKLS